MGMILRYGIEGTLHLPSSSAARLCAPPEESTVSDPVTAVAAALGAPLGFPALRQAIVPGDHVAVVWEEDLPQPSAVIAGAVRELMEGGVEASEISVVSRAPIPHEATTGELPPVRWVQHDPAARADLAYLGVSAEDEPIYLNRAVCEADLVLPLIVESGEPTFGGRQPFSTIFPALADEETIGRFRRPLAYEKAADRRRLRHHITEVSRLLGIHLVIEVIPGPGDSILQIVAGDFDAARDHAAQLSAHFWNSTLPQSADLVVAAIDGRAGQQTWRNIGRALAAARQVVTDVGAVVLCTELAAPPGPAVSRLSGASDWDTVLQKLRKDISPDVEVAWELATALRRGPVYLLSQLEDSLVESLGMAPVNDAKQISRLVERHASCTLLTSAQRLRPRVEP